MTLQTLDMMMPCYAVVLSAEVDGIKPRNNPILGKDFFAEEVL